MFSVVFGIIGCMINAYKICEYYEQFRGLSRWKRWLRMGIKSVIIVGASLGGAVIGNYLRLGTGIGYGIFAGAIAGLAINKGL